MLAHAEAGTAATGIRNQPLTLAATPAHRDGGRKSRHRRRAGCRGAGPSGRVACLPERRGSGSIGGAGGRRRTVGVARAAGTARAGDAGVGAGGVRARGVVRVRFARAIGTAGVVRVVRPGIGSGTVIGVVRVHRVRPGTRRRRVDRVGRHHRVRARPRIGRVHRVRPRPRSRIGVIRVNRPRSRSGVGTRPRVRPGSGVGRVYGIGPRSRVRRVRRVHGVGTRVGRVGRVYEMCIRDSNSPACARRAGCRAGPAG